MSDFPDVMWPNAVDSRTRAAVNHFTQHPEVSVSSPMPPDPGILRARLEYGQNLLAYSGFNAFRGWIDGLRPLLQLPTASESVSIKPSVHGVRGYVGTKEVSVGPTHRTVKVFHVDWAVTTELIVQPQKEPYDYARNRPITYEFFLESYEAGAMTADGSPLGDGEAPGDDALVQRVRLHPGQNQRITLRVSSPDIFVPAEDDGSYGEGSNAPTSKFLPPTTGIDRSAGVSSPACCTTSRRWHTRQRPPAAASPGSPRSARACRHPRRSSTSSKRRSQSISRTGT